MPETVVPISENTEIERYTTNLHNYYEEKVLIIKITLLELLETSKYIASDNDRRYLQQVIDDAVNHQELIDNIALHNLIPGNFRILRAGLLKAFKKAEYKNIKAKQDLMLETIYTIARHLGYTPQEILEFLSSLRKFESINPEETFDTAEFIFTEERVHNNEEEEEEEVGEDTHTGSLPGTTDGGQAIEDSIDGDIPTDVIDSTYIHVDDQQEAIEAREKEAKEVFLWLEEVLYSNIEILIDGNRDKTHGKKKVHAFKFDHEQRIIRFDPYVNHKGKPVKRRDPKKWLVKSQVYKLHQPVSFENYLGTLFFSDFKNLIGYSTAPSFYTKSTKRFKYLGELRDNVSGQKIRRVINEICSKYGFTFETYG